MRKNQNSYSMITALIVDDEQHAISILKTLLSECCPQVEVVAETTYMKEAMRLYKKHQTDLIFLDVEMPSGTGFDFLDSIELGESRVIFTTAHDNYMIKAIRFSALDYLLKPIDPGELTVAIDRFRKLKSKSMEQSLHFIKSVKDPNGKMDSIAISSIETIVFLKFADILYFKSERGYTIAHTADGQQHVSSRNIGEFEELLQDYRFFRVHKSYVINIDHVKKYIRGRGGSVVISDDKEIEVSRMRKSSFLKKFVG